VVSSLRNIITITTIIITTATSATIIITITGGGVITTIITTTITKRLTAFVGRKTPANAGRARAFDRNPVGAVTRRASPVIEALYDLHRDKTRHAYGQV
jgi:molybdopterin-binding protein